MIEANLKLDRDNFKLRADFSVPAAGITAIFGPSGCGKTSLLRAIAGLEPTATGNFKLDQNTWQNTDYQMPAHQRPLGYVFQEANLFPHMNVKRNLKYGLQRIPEAQRRVPYQEAVRLLGLDHLLERRPDQLSGGERQRVAIARALLTSPKLLLMDEPLAALDARSKREIMPYLERLHEELKIPVLYVSHAADEVARLADHIVLMQEGAVSAVGPISDMLTRIDLPLSQGDDAEALIKGEVTGYDKTYNLAQVAFPGGQFNVSGSELPIGHPVRLRILARDVSLALSINKDTSILNIFPATVQELSSINPSQMIVRLDTGGVSILSRITRRSADTLKLSPGTKVYAQVKSVALLV